MVNNLDLCPTMMNTEVELRHLGLIDFKEAWDYQTRLFDGIIEKKMANRKLAEKDQLPTSGYLLVCEHPHVYTLGKSGKEDHLLFSKERLSEIGARYYKINRGGDITYHGQGQLVIYPILDLDNYFSDLHKYMRFLEEAVILTLEDFGINASRVDGLTGVWLDADNVQKSRKICALGVKCSRWVTMHGLALNVNTDLSYFNHIVPCGIVNRQVTSLQQELSTAVSLTEVSNKLVSHLSNLFRMSFVV